MATKKTVKKAVSKKVAQPVKSPNVSIWNQGKRAYQTDPENVITGGVTGETSQSRKITTIRAGERCTVKREYGEQMAKLYPAEILIIE